VPSYTNAQILYYLRGGKTTNFAVFQKIKKSRDKLLRSLGENLMNRQPYLTRVSLLLIVMLDRQLFLFLKP
jgi:hypothetical protein